MVLRRRSLSAWVVCIVFTAVVGCAREIPTLADMATFDGALRIASEGEGETRSLTGRLAFDRAANSVRFVRSGAGTASPAELVHDGFQLRKLVDGKPVALALEDEADFALLSMVIAARPVGVDVVERGIGRCVLALGDRRLRIEWE